MIFAKPIIEGMLQVAKKLIENIQKFWKKKKVGQNVYVSLSINRSLIHHLIIIPAYFLEMIL